MREARLQNFLREQAEAFDRLAPKVSENPHRRDVHQLRVCVRRCRAVLWVLDRSAARIRAKKLNGLLRSLGRKLGEVRELDVALKDAGKYHIKVSGLKSRRRRRRKSLSRWLTKRAGKIHAALQEVAGRMAAVADIGMAPVKHELHREVDVWIHRGIQKDSDLHLLRISLKKARYALESMGEPVGPLRDVQEELGRIHDIEVLEGYAGRAKPLERDRKSLRAKVVRHAPRALAFIAGAHAVI